MHIPRLFLIGIMGAGKSYCAQKLGQYFAVPVFDTDVLIEKQEGETIAEMFSKPNGEQYFRELERNLLQEKEWPEGCIVSCGGGLPCFFDNMDFMLQHGLVVWINPALKMVAERLWREKSERPLVASCKTPVELAYRIEVLSAKRNPFYSRAHIEWSGTSGTETLIEQIEAFRKEQLSA
jgi:shikimate kinase